MAGRTHLEAHLPLEDLEQRYRRARDPVEHSHWHLIWLLAQGQTQATVSSVTGYSLTWIGELVRRYNTAGAAGMVDGRHTNPGRPPRLLMVGSGRAPRGPPGSSRRRAIAAIPNWAGPICGVSARGCAGPGPSMFRAILPSKPPSQKLDHGNR